MKKMSKDPRYKTVARAVRLEIDEDKGEFFIVFKVTDSQFKKHLRDHWLDDIELKLFGKNLKIKE